MRTIASSSSRAPKEVSLLSHLGESGKRLGLLAIGVAVLAFAACGGGAAATSRSTGSSACSVSTLRVHLVGSFGAGGVDGGYYGLTNVGKATCWLRGWSNVVGVRANGTSSTARHVRSTMFGPPPSARRLVKVTLRHAATAGFVLITSSVPKRGGRCAAPYRHLRVSLQYGSASKVISGWSPDLGSYMPSCGPIAVSAIVPASDLKP